MSVAANRAERQQMRQRGAANRKVKDVDFGFSFGSPSLPLTQPTPSLSVTISARPAHASSSKPSTPNKKLSRPSTPHSRRSSSRKQSTTSKTRAPGSRGTIPSPLSVFDIPPEDEPEQRSSKRRRITPFQTIEEDVPLDLGSSHSDFVKSVGKFVIEQQPQANAAEPIPTPQVGDLQPNEQLLEGGLALKHTLIPPPRQNTSPIAENDNPNQRENAEKNHTPGSERKRKKRKSVRLLPKKHPKVQVRSTPKDSPQQASAEEVEPPGLVKKKQASAEKTNTANLTPQQSPSAKTNHPNLTNEIPSNLHRGEEENESPTLLAGREVESTEGPGIEDVEPQKSESIVPEAETAQKSKPTGRKQKKKACPAKSPAKTLEANQEDVEQDGRAQPEYAATPDHRLKRRHKKEKHAPSNAIKTASKHKKPRNKNTVPVTVHRLANVTALETLSEPDDASDDERPAPEKPAKHYKHLNRGGINAADVLSQICRETLEKTVSALETNIEQEANTSRAGEWKRKCSAVLEFGTELENSLFSISELLESNFGLATRWKSEKKDVLSLRHKLLSVRKEREDVALRIDKVRRQFADDERQRVVSLKCSSYMPPVDPKTIAFQLTQHQKHDSLNNSLHDLQLALDRNQKRSQDSADGTTLGGLEFLLRTVATDVSSTAPDSQGGLLRQVQRFNEQLEWAARRLEQRRQE
ncbi:hypothetical protein LOZ65_001516 [Ophidiomyces ophidiicola]|nr:hypothetical protein LOZ65_001516 [Ophidiomyces ophidiicola]